MIRKWFLPVLAVGMLAFTIFHMVKADQGVPKSKPPLEPPRPHIDHVVAGSGIVEPQTENISIGSHLSGIVAKVQVRVDDTVEPGQVLFTLDERQMQAELRVRQANVLALQAQLDRLEQMPRPEEVPSSEARVRESEANLIDQEDQLHRVERLVAGRVVTEEDLVRHRQATAMAREQLRRAQADLALLKAGAWKPEKDITRAQLEQARAQVEQTRVEIERLSVNVPVVNDVSQMKVLQVNVRPGEPVGAQPGQALIVLGHVGRLHVRVDVDEHDIPRFVPGQPARAAVRGEPSRTFRLAFVRVEPYVIPKKSLTGSNTERVDTRVLQVIYAIEDTGAPVYVGQQVDVFIEEPLASGPASK
jgi:multidrug resistance efflux pump